MTFVRAGEGVRLSALGSTYTTKADSEDTNGAYVLLEEEFWGDPTPLHSHTTSEEAFYVLSGEVAVWLDGAEAVARADRSSSSRAVCRTRSGGSRRNRCAC